MKRISVMVATFLLGMATWAQVPKADLLDVVFNDDGTATDVSAMANTVQTIGAPSVVRSLKYGINEACFKKNGLSAMADHYYRIDYGENEAFQNGLADGHSVETLVRFNLTDAYSNLVAAKSEVKPFSSHQGGGTGIMVCKQNRGLEGNSQQEITFLPHVGGSYCYAHSGIVPENDKYYHIVGVWDKEAGEARIYINGQLLYTHSQAIGDYKPSSQPWFAIGGDAGNAGCETSFNGDVAIARVYNDPLTPEQVASLYAEVEKMDTGEAEHPEQAPGPETVDGFYQLASADDLQWFAETVNGGNTTVNAQLTADIDFTANNTMIGSANANYSGTFDGQGHKVTISLSGADNYIGLFQYLRGTVQNLVVDGHIKADGLLAAGIAACTGPNALIQRCVSNVDIESSVAGIAGHSGLVAHSWALTIRDCVYTGTISGENSTHCAGLVGWCDGYTEMQTCIMAGTINVAEGGDTSPISRLPNGPISNCYYMNPIGNDYGATQVTAEQLASGEICFQLNGDQSSIVWYQTIGEDTCPVPVKNGHQQVFANGELNCDGTPKGALTYSNTSGSTIPNHAFEDGYCVNCGAEDPDFKVEQAEDGFYLLDTPGKLYWFARQVNGGNTGMNVRLTADIDFTAYNVMIGIAANNYYGTFDGQGHKVTISLSGADNYIGLFQYLRGTVQDLVVDGTIKADAILAAGIAACTGPNALIQRCVSNVNIESSVAGIAGHSGLVAHSWALTVRDCLYTGTISGETSTCCAGLVGWCDGPTDMSGCLMTGKLEVAEGGDTSPICRKPNGTISNCCYVTPVGDDHGATQASQEQLANGEACYLLNGNKAEGAWHQTLGEDEQPVLDPTHGVVYKTDDRFSDYHDEETFLPYRDYTIESETAYLGELVATQGLIDPYLTQLESLADADQATFLASYGAMKPLWQEIQASAAAYLAYQEKVEYVAHILETDNSFKCPKRDMLLEYVSYDDGPSETFPSGCYLYIWQNHVLTTEEIQAETEWLDRTLMEAISEGYLAGTDITRLLANADFSDGFNGWEGVTGTATGLSTAGDMYGAESNRPFNMYQTVSNVKNGVYMMDMTTGFSPSGEPYSTNYAASIYAGDNMVYMPAVSETGTEMNSSTTVADAAAAGNGYTCILTHVEDGTLTVGMKSPGTGYGTDWTGMANVHLYYLGTLEEAAEKMDAVIEGQVARAKTLLAYEFGIGEDYVMYPNFSQALKDELSACIAAAQAAQTADAKYAVIGQLSNAFQQIYDCKQAYIGMLNKIEALSAATESLYPDHISEQEYQDVIARQQQVWDNYLNGSVSTEEANEIEVLKTDEDGTYIIKDNLDYACFATLTSRGNAQNANVRLEGDITYCGQMITAFSGTLDGQFHTLTLDMQTDNEGCGMIYDLSGTIKNLILRGKLTSSKGWTCGVAVRTWQGAYLANIENYVEIESSMVGGASNAGFIVLNSYEIQMDNCLYAGRMTGEQSSYCAGFVGWSSNYMSMNNCLQIAKIECSEEGSDTFMRGLAFLNNCYYQTPYGNIPGGQQTTEEQLASGELCYLLNGDQTNIQWYQTLGKDPYPVLDPTHGKVVMNKDGQFVNADATAIEDVIAGSTPAKMQGIFNTAGQKVSKATKGLYIIDGKKVIVK